MLFGSAVLELVIGLTFVFLLLSLIVSALNEWISGIFKLRAKTLRAGIGALLEDPNFQNLAGQFYAHPLVTGLTKQGKNSLPSYISAGVFVDALMDIVSPKAGEPKQPVEIYRDVVDQITNLSETNSAFGRTLVSLISSAGITPGRLEDTAKTLQTLEQARSELLTFIGRAEDEIGQIEVAGTALKSLREVERSIQEAEREIMVSVELARSNIQAYFDDSMDRVSGWYKRRVQVILIVLALLVTVLLNVDTLAIADSMLTNPTMRQSIVASAEQYVQQEDIVSAEGALATIDEIKTQVDGLGIPIGWSELPTTPGDWVSKVLGLLLTTIALAQGAPFWFDLLGKLVNVRMAGNKPDKAQAQVVVLPPQHIVTTQGPMG